MRDKLEIRIGGFESNPLPCYARFGNIGRIYLGTWKEVTPKTIAEVIIHEFFHHLLEIEHNSAVSEAFDGSWLHQRGHVGIILPKLRAVSRAKQILRGRKKKIITVRELQKAELIDLRLLKEGKTEPTIVRDNFVGRCDDYGNIELSERKSE